jgi:hypothetical protein
MKALNRMVYVTGRRPLPNVEQLAVTMVVRSAVHRVRYGSDGEPW